MFGDINFRDKMVKMFNCLFVLFFFVIFIKCIFNNKKSIVDFNMGIVLIISIIFLSLILGISIFLQKSRERIYISNKYLKRILYMLMIICIFSIQVFIAKNFHYLTGWDAGVIRDSAISLAISQEGNSLYFQQFPNNVMLLWIFKNIFNISELFQSITYEFALVIFNIIVIDIAVLLTILVSRKLFKKRMSIVTMIMCAILLIFTPWINIPYSDTIGTVFVIAILYIYLSIKECENKILKYILAALIGIIAVIGYQIKPTNIIILIAIGISSLIYSIKDKKVILSYIAVVLFVFSGIIFTKFIYNNNIANIELSGVRLSDNEDVEVPFTHFLMMGMQTRRIEETGTEVYGSYSGDDYEYTLSFETKDEKVTANIEEVKRRLKDFGVVGYIKFLDKKVNWILHDGTFFYGGEGHFVNSEPIVTGRFSKLIQKYYLPSGSKYNNVAYFYQGIWLVILFLMFIPVLDREQREEIFILRLTIVGIILFLMLFEARSRYLINHLPIFILLSVYGFQCIVDKMNSSIKLKRDFILEV